MKGHPLGCRCTDCHATGQPSLFAPPEVRRIPDPVPAPAPPLRPGAIQSTKEAMHLLKKHRSERVAKARELAVRICGPQGVTTRDVRAAMEAEGLLDPSDGQQWLGAVFVNNPSFTWRGEWREYPDDKARNLHQRALRVWHLVHQP